MRLGIAVLLLLTACSSGATTSPPPATKFCAADPRVSSFGIGTTATGAAGTMKVELTGATPSDIAQGTNEWTLLVTSPTGAPLDGLTLAVKPTMPDHGHGSSVVPTVTALGGGRYRASELSLPMRGVWSIAVQATGSVNDSATFVFCVDGS